MQWSRTPTVLVTVVLCVLVSSKRALGQDLGDGENVAKDEVEVKRGPV